MPQDLLVDVLVRKLQEGVLSSGNLDRLRGALRRQLTQTTGAGSTKIAKLRKQLGELDREIDQAADNFLWAPAEVLDLVGAKLTALKRRREHVQNALRAAEAAGRPVDVEAEIEAAVGHLWRLGEEIAQAEPARRREVFRQLVAKIELRFDQVSRGKRTECLLRSGEIHLRTGEGSIFGCVSRGDKTPVGLFVAHVCGWEMRLQRRLQ